MCVAGSPGKTPLVLKGSFVLPVSVSVSVYPILIDTGKIMGLSKNTCKDHVKIILGSKSDA